MTQINYADITTTFTLIDDRAGEALRAVHGAVVNLSIILSTQGSWKLPVAAFLPLSSRMCTPRWEW